MSKLEFISRVSQPTARAIASLAGCIISMLLGVGPVARWRTRTMYSDIREASSWDQLINPSSETLAEIEFWLTSFDKYNGFPIWPTSPVVDVLSFSDASDFAWGGYLVKIGKNIAKVVFSEAEANSSSKEPPIISYTYTKTIASKIFNFSSTLLDLDYHQFHNNPSPCECNTSSHLYEPYGHVITGDLSIIPNSKLRDLIAKGPKYREPCKVDWDKNLSLLCEAVDQYALQWAKREIVELSVLSSWKEMVKGQIEERISKLKQNFKQPTGKVLQNVDVKACLSDLHNN